MEAMQNASRRHDLQSRQVEANRWKSGLIELTYWFAHKLDLYNSSGIPSYRWDAHEIAKS